MAPPQDSPASIHVRRATQADVPLVLRFIRGLADYEKLAHLVVASEDRLREHLFGPSPTAEVLIGELDGRPASFALFYQNFSTFLALPGIYLEDLFVEPDHRGRGLGKALLLHLAGLAVERGCGRLEWSVLDWNQPAIDFYNSLGAQAIDGWTTFRLTQPAMRRLIE